MAVYDETLTLDARSKIVVAITQEWNETLDFAARSKMDGEVQNLSEWLALYADQAITEYLCEVRDETTGALLATLPMKSFQAKLKKDFPDYLSVVIAGDELFTSLQTWIANGAHIVVRKTLRVQDIVGAEEEIARVKAEPPRMDKGGSSASVTIYGHRQSISSGVNRRILGTPKILRVVRGNIQATFSEPDLYLRAGDTVEIPGEAPFVAGIVSYVVSNDGTTGMYVTQEPT